MKGIEKVGGEISLTMLADNLKFLTLDFLQEMSPVVCNNDSNDDP